MTNEGLQRSLKQIHEKVGAFKLNTELFPMMTHEGTEDGRVVFVGTPYLKDKFGSEGGLTVFKAQLWNNNIKERIQGLLVRLRGWPKRMASKTSGKSTQTTKIWSCLDTLN